MAIGGAGDVDRPMTAVRRSRDVRRGRDGRRRRRSLAWLAWSGRSCRRGSLSGGSIIRLTYGRARKILRSTIVEVEGGEDGHAPVGMVAVIVSNGSSGIGDRTAGSSSTSLTVPDHEAGIGAGQQPWASQTCTWARTHLAMSAPTTRPKPPVDQLAVASGSPRSADRSGSARATSSAHFGPELARCAAAAVLSRRETFAPFLGKAAAPAERRETQVIGRMYGPAHDSVQSRGQRL